MNKLILAIFGIVLMAGGGWQWREYQEKQLRSELEQKVSRYWDAVISNDQLTIYGMEAGKKSGELSPDAFYDRQMAKSVEIVGYSVEEIDIQGEYAKAKIDVLKTFAALRGVSYKGGVSDAWILIDNEWFHDTPLGKSISPEEKFEKKSAPIPQIENDSADSRVEDMPL